MTYYDLSYLELLPLNVFFLLFSSVMIFFGLFAYTLKKRLFMVDLIIASVVGIILGPYASGLLNPLEWPSSFLVLQEITLVVLGIQVVSNSFALYQGYLWKNKRDLFILLGPVLLLTWGASSLLVWAILDLDPAISCIIGAAITPTDPVIASAIVRGRLSEECIPEALRDLINAESCANDGLAAPIVAIPLVFLLSDAPNPAYYIIVETICIQVVFSAVLSGGIGWAFARLLHFSEKHRLIDKESILAFSAALTFFILGLNGMYNGSAVLACFIGGYSFSYLQDDIKRIQHDHVSNAYDLLTTSAFFVLFGSLLPFDAWAEIGVGKLFGATIAVILLRRIPFVILFAPLLREAKGWKEIAVLAWFGPIGAAPLYYAFYVGHALGDSTVFNVVSFTVFISIFVHGLSASPCAQLLERFQGRQKRTEAHIEQKDTFEDVSDTLSEELSSADEEGITVRETMTEKEREAVELPSVQDESIAA